MCSKGRVHGCAYNSKVVLLFEHEFFQCLHGCLLLSGFRVNQGLRIIIRACSGSISVFRGINGRIRTALFLGEAEVDEIDEVRLIRVVANNNVCRLQITMNVAL